MKKGIPGIISGKIARYFIVTILIYLTITIPFYYIAGGSLYLRNSKNNIDMPEVTSGTIEMVAGSSVAQTFVSEVQILDGINIQWGTYRRLNAGHLYIALYDETDKTRMLYQSIDASTLSEGQTVRFLMEKPNETAYGHMLNIRITTDDGISGSSATPLMSTRQLEKGNLYLNEKPVEGMLCFSTIGQDHVWLGTHYWELVFGVAIILLCYLFFLAYKYKRGKKSIVLYAFVAIKKYSFLMQQMVSRDFKTKYKRSILGVLWSFLNPLLSMSVMYFVFSNLFKADIPNYHIYLLVGVIFYNFFSEACGTTLISIISNAGLITKVYIPKYIYPLSKVTSATINFLISLIPLIIAIVLTGIKITASYLLLLYPIVCIVIFSMGLGMILASSMVFFRDTQFLWNIINMIWMYATPIFYSPKILPQKFLFVLQINPLYYIISFCRTCILSGVSPDPILYLQCGLFAVGMLIVGSIVFKRTQDRFILSL